MLSAFRCGCCAATAAVTESCVDAKQMHHPDGVPPMTEAIEAYLFYEMAALLVLAAAVGFIGLLLRQPLIVSFIAVGILAGPSVFDIARSDEQIDLLAELGIAVLLFLVGLKLDFKLVRTLGPVAL
jgi:NhaP-type Na+/H+ or K+/H+ antiporter